MNRFALLPIFLLLFSSLKAQDKIISTTHDTIQCRIVSIDNERILYEVKGKNGSVTGKFIDLSQVANYTRSPTSNNNTKQHLQRRTRPVIVPDHVWNLRLNVGKSTMPWYLDNIQVVNSMQNYYNKLKTGYHLNSSVIYMTTNNLGFGLDYSFLYSSFNGSIQTPIATSMYVTTTERFNQYIHFFGPTAIFQQNIDVNRKFTFSESVSVGALFIRMEDQNTYPIIDQSSYTDFTVNTLLTSFSLAAKIGITAEYRLSQNVSVGYGAGFIYGSFKKANLEMRDSNTSISLKNQELSNALNVSRFDYSLVVRYRY